MAGGAASRGIAGNRSIAVQVAFEKRCSSPWPEPPGREPASLLTSRAWCERQQRPEPAPRCQPPRRAARGPRHDSGGVGRSHRGHRRQPFGAQERSRASDPVSTLTAICDALDCRPGDILDIEAPDPELTAQYRWRAYSSCTSAMLGGGAGRSGARGVAGPLRYGESNRTHRPSGQDSRPSSARGRSTGAADVARCQLARAQCQSRRRPPLQRHRTRPVAIGLGRPAEVSGRRAPDGPLRLRSVRAVFANTRAHV